MKDIIESEFNEHLKTSKLLPKLTDKVAICAKLCINSLKSGGKILLFGNGGSASIASHFSMDLTNNSNIKCYSYNDPALITCYANDFKYENWISRVIQKYGNKDDLLILISSSGKSKNMLNAVTAAKKMKFSKVVTFTGFDINNSLKKRGDINIWIDSKMYNVIENSHQFYLLLLVDMIKKFKK